ncbi:uncharacterized protein cubi_02801 [Cryptosporidium ubiquitum]|uniref:Uncharacterized protein n=1 Tax=Cryptosporidium ubiquitum TaxID=857276 RepID=A0A1J4MJ21_9CRYT|nr:uncharacterized protein cubi_02801 [Cryptosporidium ubiquitum]OII73999.1 hypothetical protein cubi_02801 [Cryptosporidium ubiquitum]
MLRFFLNLTTILLSLSLFNQAYGIRVEPRVTETLDVTAKENISESQVCVLKTLKQLVLSNGRIPPKITKKRINQAVLLCKEKINTTVSSTIAEETIFMTLGQYGHLSEIDTTKALKFINEIQKESKTTVGSYTRMYKLSQNSHFCKLYEDFILSAYPNEYFISFLPEDGERCQELLKRLKQNSFYSYWSQGGVVADQAQPIIDDNVSNDPIKTRETVINNIFQNPQVQETQAQEVHKSDNKTQQTNLVDEKRYEEYISARSEIENMELEVDQDSGCCSSCSCGKKKTEKEDKNLQKMVDNSMTEEELELMRLEKELEKPKSACCSCCTSSKKKNNNKEQKDQENKTNESLDDVVGVDTNLRKSETEENKQKNSRCCSCSSSSKKNSKKPKEDDYNIKDEETDRNGEQNFRNPEDSVSEEKESKSKSLKKNMDLELLGCCSCCCCSKKGKEKEKGEEEKKSRKLSEFEEESNQGLEEQEEPNKVKKDSKNKKDKKDKKNKKNKKDKKGKDKDKEKTEDSELNARILAGNSLIEEEFEKDENSGCCSNSSSSKRSKNTKNELRELEELEMKLEEEERRLAQQKMRQQS